MSGRVLIALGLLGASVYVWFKVRGDSSPVSGEISDTLEPSLLDNVTESINQGVQTVVDFLRRGERNNNPGNIRTSSTSWLGEILGTDSAFETFDSPTHGIRAIAKLVKNYQSKYGLNTVHEIISRYAPSSENNTGAYVNAVASDMGVAPNAPLDLRDPNTLQSMTVAIIRHENGRVIYSQSQIADAVNQA